jgi:hypothetical protein
MYVRVSVSVCMCVRNIKKKHYLLALLTNLLTDDIGWILKLFKETMEKKEKVHRNFADGACEEIQMCAKWVDPSVEEEPEMEMVFS